MRIKELRQAKGLSQPQVAAVMGVTIDALYGREPPSVVDCEAS